jgi:hypothetical protein
MNTGVLTPVVTGLGNPGGMVFVDTSPSAGKQDQDHTRNQCNNDQ